MKVAYAVSSRLPGRAANAMQVMKMAQAMMDFADVQMTAALGEGDGDLRSLYGVERVPPLKRFPLKGRLGAHIFGARSALAARSFSPDVLLTRSVITAAWGARLGIQTIFECHAPPQGMEKHYWRALMTSKRLRRLVVISEALHRIISEAHPEVRDKDMIVAHDGVDTKQYRDITDPVTAKRKLGLRQDRLIAAYAGHLYAGRGIEVVLAVARALPGWQFRIIGGTQEDIRSWKEKARNQTNVEFLGFVENSRLPEELSVADVLLMPYQKAVFVSGGKLDTSQWMSPLKMFEYMAMRRAIVSSDLPVLREVLDDSLALLVEPDNAQAWVSSLRKLEDPDLRAALAERAGDAVRAYDWCERARQMLMV